MRYSEIMLEVNLANNYAFSPEDRKALRGLTRDSRDLNRHLHAQYNSRAKIVDIKRTRQIDAALNYYKTPVPLVVYSGLAEIPHIGIYHHAGYLHTSLNLETAKHFAQIHPKKGTMITTVGGGTLKTSNYYILRINVPAGFPGAYVGHITNQWKDKRPSMLSQSEDYKSENEEEFILPRNLDLKIYPHPKTTINRYNIVVDDVEDRFEDHFHIYKSDIIIS